jgi:hypothetical protein
MCKICVLASRHSRVRQETLVLNLSQFTSTIRQRRKREAVAAQPTTETSPNQLITLAQDKPS